MVAVWTRRAAKPDQDVEHIVPHHVVEDFRDLARVLRDHYGVPLVEF
jgi:hypothetical protein